MMSPLRRAAGEDRSWLRTTLLATGLVAFFALDIVLVVAAVHATSGDDPGRPGPIPTFTSTPGPESTAKPTTTPSPAATVQASSATAPRMLSAASATVALRATPGSCPGGSPVIERTADAGATWTPVDLGDRAVDRVVALDAGTQKSVVTGMQGASCTASSAASFTAGQFWADSPDDLPGSAYIVPGSDSLHLTEGVTRSPCPTPSIVTESASEAAVSCTGVFAARTGDAPWQLVDVAHLAGFARSGSAYLLAVTGVEDCPGVSIQAVDRPVTADSLAAEVGCAPEPASFDPSALALAASGSDVWLWAGSRVSVSTDGGATW